MTSRSVEFTPLARTDLAGIWSYSAETWSVEQADAYVDEIDNVINALANGRRLGQSVEVRSGYLRAFVGSHAVYFRLTLQELRVYRILHQAMDIRRHL